MVVIFPLVPHGGHDDRLAIDDLEQRDATHAPERDDQLTQEGARADLAASERRALQQLQAGLDRVERLFGQVEVATLTGQLTLDHELDQQIPVSAPRCSVAELEPEPLVEHAPLVTQRLVARIADRDVLQISQITDSGLAATGHFARRI